MGARDRRIRAALDSQFWVVFAILAICVVGGGYLTYDTYADPGFHVEHRAGEEATYTGSFVHQATVQRPNPVFPPGETLRNREAYFTRLAPRLNGTFSFTYSATESGELATDVALELRFRSVGESGENGQPVEYWSITRQLTDAEAASLAPGETLETNFSQNVSELFNESQRIDERVGGTPGAKTIRVVATVETEGRVNGRDVSWTREYPLQFVDEESIYRVQGPGRVVNRTNTTQTVQVENTFGPLRRGGAPLLAILGFVGLVVLAVGRYRNAIALTDSERAYVPYERARAEFDDWITTARITPATFDGERIDVETLDGLVDVAIDSDRRVLEDAADGTCYCRVDDLVYRFEPPAEPPDGPLATLGEQGGPAVPGNRPDEWEESTTSGESEPIANGGNGTGESSPDEGDHSATDDVTDGDAEGRPDGS